jgi:hypothetical protein
MMVSLQCDIELGGLRFYTQSTGDRRRLGVHEVSIESTWDQLTDTATVMLPKKISLDGKSIATGLNPWLRRGDKVKLNLGYEQTGLNEMFVGFIDFIDAKVPVGITCQDGMFLLKKGELTLSYKAVSLKALMADVIGNLVEYEVVADMNLGQFRITKATPAKVLEYLREHYLVRSWFRAGRLYVGLAYVAKLQRAHQLSFTKDIVEHSLEWRVKEQVTLLAKGIIVDRKNKRKEVEVGDKGGETRTFHYYDLSESEVKRMLERELERMRYDGYRGSLTTFGDEPYYHGDTVKLFDVEYPERAGIYLIKKVVTKFGLGGYRQELELEERV